MRTPRAQVPTHNSTHNALPAHGAIFETSDPEEVLRKLLKAKASKREFDTYEQFDDTSSGLI